MMDWVSAGGGLEFPLPVQDGSESLLIIGYMWISIITIVFSGVTLAIIGGHCSCERLLSFLEGGHGRAESDESGASDLKEQLSAAQDELAAALEQVAFLKMKIAQLQTTSDS